MENRLSGSFGAAYNSSAAAEICPAGTLVLFVADWQELIREDLAFHDADLALRGRHYCAG